jgi:hypothetical protein
MGKKSKSPPARQSGDSLFSISAASDILRRSRRTLTRALMDVRPDKIESDLRLWRLSRIIDAVNSNSQAPILTSATVSGELQDLFARLNAADDKMRAIESLAGRRTFAKKTLLPLMCRVDHAMREDGRANGEPDMYTHLRCDAHLRLLVEAGLGPDATNGCDWAPSQAWAAYNNAAGADEDDEAA